MAAPVCQPSGLGPPCPPSRRERRPLADDTPVEVEDLQIEAWRRMSPAEKAALVTSLTNATFTLARAGVRQRHPNASEREVFLRLAILTLGPDLAQRAYPAARALTEP
jgi:hypothetical protein